MERDAEHPSQERGATPSRADIAANWVARRNVGLKADERRELNAWLATNEQNAEAFVAADRSATVLDWPLHLGAADEVMAGLAVRAQQRKRRRRMSALAAVAAVVLAGAIFTRTFSSSSVNGVRPGVLVVKTPERTTLPDGSIVELKDGARIVAHFSDQTRRVTLLRGTAHFRVQPNSRPFVVVAAGVTAEALGTEFSVELEGPSVSVLVTHGRVAVNKKAELSTSDAAAALPGDAFAVLEAGNALSLSLDNSSLPQAPTVEVVPVRQVEERMAWRIPRLEFSGTPLRDVVGMLNQHNVLQIEIADRSIETLALSGVFRADKLDALLDLLQSEFKVRSEARDGKIVLQSAR